MLERISNYILAYGSEQMNDPVVQTTPHSNNFNLLNLPKKGKRMSHTATSLIAALLGCGEGGGGHPADSRTPNFAIYLYLQSLQREVCVVICCVVGL